MRFQLLPLHQNRLSCGHHLWTYDPHVLRLVKLYLFSLKLETVNGDIPQSYQTGGLIIMLIFIVYVIFWGVLWFWGARKRETMRREIVERQLAIIRHEEETQEQQDLAEERAMIEAKRLQR